MNSLPFPIFSSSKLRELDCKINSTEAASHAQCASETKCVPQDGHSSNSTDGADVPKKECQSDREVVSTELRPEAALESWYQVSVVLASLAQPPRASKLSDHLSKSPLLRSQTH